MSRKLKLLFFLGRPLSPLYSVLMRIRAYLYRKGVLKRHRLPVPVVSVGNLTMGGSGKTPLVMYMARLLAKTGNPAIISRGYGGKAGGEINVVSDGKTIYLDASLAGDEPRLLAEALPGVMVLTGAKRPAVGRHAVESLHTDVILLDDGFQHMALHRDLDLVLFSARSFLGNGRVFPGGDLREPLNALGRAHAFVITGVDSQTRERADACKDFLQGRFPGIPVFAAEYRATGIVPGGNQQETVTVAQAKEMLLFGFCGIANPESFRETLGRDCFDIVGFKSFGDHHRYTAQDVSVLLRLAQSKGAHGLIATEKDLVKLESLLDGATLPVLALKIELVMEKGFDAFVAERIAHQL